MSYRSARTPNMVNNSSGVILAVPGRYLKDRFLEATFKPPWQKVDTALV